MTGRPERLRDGIAPFVLYPTLALLAFPTIGILLFGQDAVVVGPDVFDLPRMGVGADWLANGPTLWNAHLMAGTPLLAGHLSPYAIDVALAFVVGPFWAWAIAGWLTAALAGIAMHLFLRDVLALSTAAVVGGAVVFGLAFWHPGYGVAVALLPAGLWCLERAWARRRGRWPWLVAGIVIAAFTFHHSIAQVAVLVAGLALVYTVVSRREPPMRVRVATWAAVWGLGLALYAPVLLTQLELLPVSHRTVWDLTAFIETRPLPALRAALEHYSAVLIGVPLRSGLGSSPGAYGTYFLGAIGLPAIVLGLVGRRHDRRTWFLIGTLVAIPVIDLVAVLVTPMQDALGPFRSFQFVRIRHLLPFALAAVAALGFDVVATAWSTGGPVLPVARWRRIAIALSFVPLVVTFLAAVRGVGLRLDALRDGEVAAIGWVVAAVALGIGFAAVGLVALVTRRRGGQRPTAPRVLAGVLVVLLLLLATERIAYAHAERFLAVGLDTWARSLARTPAQAFLLDQPGIATDRVLTFGDEPGRMGAQGLSQVDGYESIHPIGYHRFFGALIAPQLASDPERWTYFHRWGNRAQAFGPGVDPELVALSGTRWLYVRGDDVPTVPGIVPRFRDGGVTVYEVPQVLPRAFVADALDVRADADDVIDAIAMAPLEELARTAFVAAGPEADALAAGLAAVSPGGGQPADEARATIAVDTPDRVEIEVDGDRSGILVLTDTMAPGWVAEVDGRRTPVATVDAAFRGVPVGPGAHRVVFSYEPVSTAVGFVLAALAVLATIALAALLWRRDRDRDPRRDADGDADVPGSPGVSAGRGPTVADRSD